MGATRKQIINELLTIFNIADKTGENGKRYKQMLTAMTDVEFGTFMIGLKDDTPDDRLWYSTQNMTQNIIDIDDMLSAAEYLGLEVFEHLWITDEITGERFKTPQKYIIVEIPVRRAQQYHDHKISVPSDDRKIDNLSGQVTGDSRSANITSPEMLALIQRNLPNTALELVKVRGGDTEAYDEFSRSCYETGTGSLEGLSPHSRSRSSVTVQMYLLGMMLDSDFTA